MDINKLAPVGAIEKKHLLSPFHAEKADVFLSEAGTISLPLPISVSVLFC